MKTYRSNALCIAWMILIIAMSLGGTAATPGAATTAEPTTKPKMLASGAFNWKDLVARSSDIGEQRPILRSPTATLDELEVHATMLKPGQQPHPPHQHPYEEMVVMTGGTLDATVNGRDFHLENGSVLFLAPNDLHGWRNNGTTPATYFIITWHTPLSGAAK